MNQRSGLTWIIVTFIICVCVNSAIDKITASHRATVHDGIVAGLVCEESLFAVKCHK